MNKEIRSSKTFERMVQIQGYKANMNNKIKRRINVAFVLPDDDSIMSFCMVRFVLTNIKHNYVKTMTSVRVV